MTSSNKDEGEVISQSADKAGDGVGENAGDGVSSASSAAQGKMSAEELLIAQVAKAAEAEGLARAQASAGDTTSDETEEGVGDNVGGESIERGLETRVEDLSDRLSRALAEVENSRRRFEREKGDALRYGASRLAMDMFEVADNLGRARSFVNAEAMESDIHLKNLVVGIEMTEKLLGDAFSRNGIVVIAPEVGAAFSVDEHQAISEIESEEVKEGCVVEVVLRGYRMGERLLRPAQVVTAKRKRAETETEKTQENDTEETKADG